MTMPTTPDLQAALAVAHDPDAVYALIFRATDGGMFRGPLRPLATILLADAYDADAARACINALIGVRIGDTFEATPKRAAWIRSLGISYPMLKSRGPWRVRMVPRGNDPHCALEHVDEARDGITESTSALLNPSLYTRLNQPEPTR